MDPLLGAWKLLKYHSEFRDGSPSKALFGADPIGYLVFTPQNRMIGLLEAAGRKAPQTDADAAALLRSMIAYSGVYRLEKDKWTTRVDAAWNPGLTGTDQVRYFRLDGDRLFITSEWMPSQNLPGNPVIRAILEWQRIQ